MTTVSITLTDEQIVEAIRQMPPAQRRRALFALAAEALADRTARQAAAEAEMRRLCAARNLDWDRLTEAEREALVDDIMHEDRCRAGRWIERFVSARPIASIFDHRQR